MRDSEARELLAEYDRLRHRRMDAESLVQEPPEIGSPERKVLERFTSLARYLTLLYEMYYRTEYPDAPVDWIRCASYIRVHGELDADEDGVEAAEDIMRYEVWANGDNRAAYIESLRRLKHSPKSYEIFVRKINDEFEKIFSTPVSVD